MGRHLPSVALPRPFREVIDRQLARSDPTTEHERAIAIITGDVIAILQLHAERSQGLMAHPGNVEMSFALTIQILLAQVAVPALEKDREKAQLIFFAESGHGGSENGLLKRANTQLSTNSQQLCCDDGVCRFRRDVLPHVRRFSETESNSVWDVRKHVPPSKSSTRDGNHGKQ
jgi:hypothetical protein